MKFTSKDPSKMLRLATLFMVFIGGFCALSWEIIWQAQLSLATGSSARATAITLFCFSLGTALGSFLVGRENNSMTRCLARPFLAYGLLELCIGLSGLVLPILFQIYTRVDAILFLSVPSFEWGYQLLLSFLIVAAPTIAMGASLPVFSRLATVASLSLSTIYAANVAGACLGILAAVFFFLPSYGLSGTGHILAAGNAIVLILGIMTHNWRVNNVIRDLAKEKNSIGVFELLVVFLTGFATFALEVVWFRALRAAFWNTAQTFGIILFSVLLALTLAAVASSQIPFSRRTFVRYLTLGGLLILVATPLIERVDIVIKGFGVHNDIYLRFFMSFLLIGPPFFSIGMVLPQLVSQISNSKTASIVFAINTIGSLAGTLCALWVLLPFFGFVHSSWLVGVVVMVAAIPSATWPLGNVLLILSGLIWASALTTGAGLKRVIGAVHYHSTHRVLASFEGPDVTASVVQLPTFGNHSTLLIDGFAASTEDRVYDAAAWMAHLPMLMHPSSDNVLVICFGTGQTLNVVRQEGAQTMDMVEINPRVFEFASYFSINQGVLNDSKVRPIIMDGRAWLRRTNKKYDVITLDPMPPSHSGMNSLYSLEFYKSVHGRLNPGGIIAQWFPIHLLSSENAKSIAKTFISVFPNAILWMHPDPSFTHGIMIGKSAEAPLLDIKELSFALRPLKRTLSEKQVKETLVMNANELVSYACLGDIITDDNQLLSYRNYYDILHRGSRTSEEVAKDLMPHILR